MTAIATSKLIINLAGQGDIPTEAWTTTDSLCEYVVIVPRNPADEVGQVRRIRVFDAPGDQFWITGRGPVFTYESNPAQDLWNPDDLRNTWVVIQGGLYFVIGVEAFRPIISPTQPYGNRSLGILVRPQTNLGRTY